MSKIDKKKKIVIGSIVGVILVGVIIFATWFFNRKFNISFDLGNGTKVSTVMVKYNKTIDEKNIKGKKELGDSFVNWYEIIEVKDGMECSEEEINTFCQGLPRYKRPKRILFEDIPRNATGKIEKPKLRKLHGADNLVAQETET